MNADERTSTSKTIHACTRCGQVFKRACALANHYKFVCVPTAEQSPMTVRDRRMNLSFRQRMDILVQVDSYRARGLCNAATRVSVEEGIPLSVITKWEKQRDRIFYYGTQPVIRHKILRAGYD